MRFQREERFVLMLYREKDTPHQMSQCDPVHVLCCGCVHPPPACRSTHTPTDTHSQLPLSSSGHTHTSWTACFCVGASAGEWDLIPVRTAGCCWTSPASLWAALALLVLLVQWSTLLMGIVGGWGHFSAVKTVDSLLFSACNLNIVVLLFWINSVKSLGTKDLDLVLVFTL